MRAVLHIVNIGTTPKDLIDATKIASNTLSTCYTSLSRTYFMRISNKRQGRERGSEVVEFGLVCVPFFAFMLLILDISWAIFNKAVLQHAVEEGVRYAITYHPLTGLGQEASIKSVVQNNAIGMLQGSSG